MEIEPMIELGQGMSVGSHGLVESFLFKMSDDRSCGKTSWREVGLRFVRAQSIPPSKIPKSHKFVVSFVSVSVSALNSGLSDRLVSASALALNSRLSVSCSTRPSGLFVSLWSPPPKSPTPNKSLVSVSCSQLSLSGLSVSCSTSHSGLSGLSVSLWSPSPKSPTPNKSIVSVIGSQLSLSGLSISCSVTALRSLSSHRSPLSALTGDRSLIVIAMLLGFRVCVLMVVIVGVVCVLTGTSTVKFTFLTNFYLLRDLKSTLELAVGRVIAGLYIIDLLSFTLELPQSFTLVTLDETYGYHVWTDPRLTDYNTLLENIPGLKEGKPAQVPIYDLKSSSRTGYMFASWSLSWLHVSEAVKVLSAGFMDFETNTNPIDRSIAYLLFHGPSDLCTRPANDALSLESRTIAFIRGKIDQAPVQKIQRNGKTVTIFTVGTGECLIRDFKEKKRRYVDPDASISQWIDIAVKHLGRKSV
ncbi:hypothetical protein Syun_012823 [Stephania yunnanensis]|uniref:Uncharacterized protein n=1 Tax=Stephania yunnanensis TaxID=152371 RepID=A0AAP0PFQ2_9MAGN